MGTLHRTQIAKQSPAISKLCGAKRLTRQEPREAGKPAVDAKEGAASKDEKKNNDGPGDLFAGTDFFTND